MIKITIKTKEGVIHSFGIERDQELLSTLDKFLKKNKMSLSDFFDIHIDCGELEDSASCKIAKISIEAIKAAGKDVKSHHLT